MHSSDRVKDFQKRPINKVDFFVLVVLEGIFCLFVCLPKFVRV